MFKALMIFGAFLLPFVQGSAIDFKVWDCTTSQMKGKINSIEVVQKPKEMDDTTILNLNISLSTPMPNEFASARYEVLKLNGGKDSENLVSLCGSGSDYKCPITSGVYTVKIRGLNINSGTFEVDNTWVNMNSETEWICYAISYKHSRRRNLRGVVSDDDIYYNNTNTNT
jgi:hypothetical protein